MAALDTNVLVRVLAQDEPSLAGRAEACVRAHAPVWIPLPALMETCHVLARLYRWEKPALLAMLRTIAHSRDFLCQDHAAVVDATEQWAKSKAGFVDCLNAALAQAHRQGPLATFDRDALRLPGTMDP